MNEVTRVLSTMKLGDAQAAEQLLPLVYEELRALAAQQLARERAGQTLQPTALVHEAYLRLVDADREVVWNSRGHFFAAAAQAMRRILVENARRKGAVKRGGGLVRDDREIEDIPVELPQEDVLALDEALIRLATVDAAAAELVQLRYFAGLTLPDAAEFLNLSPRSAGRLWAFARAWLRREVEGSAG